MANSKRARKPGKASSGHVHGASCDCGAKGRKRAAPFCLAVGGFDPSGGAGVLADAAAFLVMGARPLAAVTTVTVQNHARFLGAAPVAPAVLDRQLGVVLNAYHPCAAKTGAFPTAAHVRIAARRLGAAGVTLVVDPVLGASHGRGLVDPTVGREIVRSLLPFAALATPNVAEASALTGLPIRDAADAERAGRRLLDLGAGAVLVKGGHGKDGGHVFVTPDGSWLVPAGPRKAIPTHGSGCTLAAAIAGALASGDELSAAVVRAQEFILACFALAVRRRGAWAPDPLAALADAAAAAFALE